MKENGGSGKRLPRIEQYAVQGMAKMRAMEWERPFSHPLSGLAVGHTSFAIFLFVRQQSQSVLFFV